MTLDDPVVIVMIIVLVIFLFGSSKIPEFAHSLGRAKKAFQQGLAGLEQETEEKKTA